MIVACDLLTEKVSKEVSLKLVEFSKSKFYMQFGKTSRDNVLLKLHLFYYYFIFIFLIINLLLLLLLLLLIQSFSAEIIITIANCLSLTPNKCVT